jgi:hypothetical protein
VDLSELQRQITEFRILKLRIEGLIPASIKDESNWRELRDYTWEQLAEQLHVLERLMLNLPMKLQQLKDQANWIEAAEKRREGQP